MHSKTQASYQEFLNQKPHALLIIGQASTGTTDLARSFAAEVLQQPKLENYAYYTQVNASEKGIDAVRSLRQFFSKKTTGQNTIRRIAVLTDAELLSPSAQNALLKTIEEPPADSILVLTATDSTGLLGTILSRVQILNVLPLELQQVLSDPQLKHHDQNKIIKAYHMSGGGAGLLQAILEDDEHELVAGLLEAKQIVGAPVFERLAKIDGIIKSKQDVGLLLDSTQRVLDSGFYLAASKNRAQASKLHQARKAVAQARQHLKHSVNQKLLLTNLFLSL